MLFRKQKKESSQPNIISKVKENKEDRKNIQSDSQGEIEYEIFEKEILPEKMICPDCGGITLVGLDFCDKCGGELMNRDN
jgi:ribosomal protein S27AE